MSLDSEIRRPASNVFRRAFIKRRLGSTGLFEPTFFEITDLIQKFGSFNSSIDAVRHNRFLHSGVTLIGRNDTGKFNDENNISSLWSGFLTRRRTLIKIEQGYLDTDGSDLPTDPSAGIFILDNEIPISAKSNQATLKCSSLKSIFDKEPAADIAGLAGTQTASGLWAKIRDHTDGSGSVIFRQFISSASWVIQATTANYNYSTDTTLDGISTWQLMEQLAAGENKVPVINRTGGIEFRSRDARTTAVAFAFEGQGFVRPTIKSLDWSKEPWNKIFAKVRLKYIDADTSTSFVSAGTATVVSPNNLQWKDGQETFKYENFAFSDTATAQASADATLVEVSTGKEEIQFKGVVVPTLEVLDRISVSYRSYDIVGQTLWDHFNWDEANWADEGENFDYNQREFVLIKKNPSVDDFMATYQARKA